MRCYYHSNSWLYAVPYLTVEYFRKVHEADTIHDILFNESILVVLNRLIKSVGA